ncbi:MAG: putative toxin-antitoxin system toxin component, PIN family [Leptospirillia bacterium]
MERVVLPSDIPRACRDPNDNPILEIAISGRCRCLVTGDRDLLVLKNLKMFRSSFPPISGPTKPAWSIRADRSKKGMPYLVRDASWEPWNT